jgi:hypothetical protein
MVKFALLLFVVLSAHFGFAQIKADSVFLFYGMSQEAPSDPLMDYIENLETSGAKLQKLKAQEWENVNSCFKNVKSKKYKSSKHTGTVYFFTFFIGDDKKFGAIDTSAEHGTFINLSDKTVYTIKDPAAADKLYYTLLKIH